jgi:hypothetical protein
MNDDGNDANLYLNDFHREHCERLKRHLAEQPHVSLEEALAQYERIKRGSSRRHLNKKLDCRGRTADVRSTGKLRT